MLDPRIALATTVPDIGKTFSNILTNVGRMDTIKENRELAPFRKQALMDAQEQGGLNRELTQTQIDSNLVSNMSNREKQWASSIYQGAMGVKPFLDNQDAPGAMNYLQQRHAQLKQQGMPTQHTEQAIQQLQSDPRGFINSVDAAIQSFQGLQQGQSSQYQRGANGQVFDTRTGQSTYDPSFAANQDVLNTQELEHKKKVTTLQTDAEQTRKNNELTLKRNSDIISEKKKKYQGVAAQNRRVNRALKLSSQALQGYGGELKIQASRIFPDMDVSNEAGLDQAFTELAMDVLTQFKGPTTDFEFGVAQTIPGRLSDGRSGNTAKLKSIKRALWFVGEEDRQFQAHLKSGGQAEDFRFNILKEVKTKSGMQKLEDIQATAVENHMTIEEVIKRLNQ